MRLFYLLAISTFFFASCGSEYKSIASDLGQKQVIEAD